MSYRRSTVLDAGASAGGPLRKSKSDRLLELGRQRREARWQGYRCIGDFQGGAYECEHVSPITKAACNIDSDVFVLLQDWSSERNLERRLDPGARDLGYTPSEPTNKRLAELLRAHFNLDLADVYATNMFPFVKPGTMTEGIPRHDLSRAAREFAIPQIEIVNPRLVVCLGLDTFSAMRQVLKAKPVRSLTEALASPVRIGGQTSGVRPTLGTMGR